MTEPDMNQPEIAKTQHTAKPPLNLEHDAEIVISEQAIDKAIRQIAEKLNQEYAQLQYQNAPIKVYCVMNGGLYFAGQLLRYLTFPLELSYLHATRYGKNARGSELFWKTRPSADAVNSNHILLLDDIFDEGLTLEAIDTECRHFNPQSVQSVVLIDKKHQCKPKNGFKPDFIGLEVEDRYIFGCGMDYQGLWRNLPAVYALKS